jgi:hypothetical protein
VARVVELEVGQPRVRQLLHDALLRQKLTAHGGPDAGEGQPSDLRNVKSQPLDSSKSQGLEDSVVSVPRSKIAKSTSK